MLEILSIIMNNCINKFLDNLLYRRLILLLVRINSRIIVRLKNIYKIKVQDSLTRRWQILRGISQIQLTELQRNKKIRTFLKMLKIMM